MDLGSAGGDTSLLDLKISDLVADATPMPVPAKVITAPTQAAK
jgi:hypothetical protein